MKLVRCLSLLTAVVILATCEGDFVPKATTSLDDYDDVLRNWASTGLVDHFPRLAPTETEGVVFSSFPGFLQGGGWVQLKIPVSDAELSVIENYCKARTSEPLQFERDGPHEGHVFGDGVYSFPHDFQQFVFFAKPYKQGTEHDWNHGSIYGLAISTKRNEVVYWAEAW